MMDRLTSITNTNYKKASFIKEGRGIYLLFPNFHMSSVVILGGGGGSYIGQPFSNRGRISIVLQTVIFQVSLPSGPVPPFLDS